MENTAYIITAVNNNDNFPAAALEARDAGRAGDPGTPTHRGRNGVGLCTKHQRGCRRRRRWCGTKKNSVTTKGKKKLFSVVHKSEKLTLMPKQKRRAPVIINSPSMGPD